MGYAPFQYFVYIFGRRNTYVEEFEQLLFCSVLKEKNNKPKCDYQILGHFWSLDTVPLQVIILVLIKIFHFCLI